MTEGPHLAYDAARLVARGGKEDMPRWVEGLRIFARVVPLIPTDDQMVAVSLLEDLAAFMLMNLPVDPDDGESLGRAPQGLQDEWPPLRLAG